MKRILTRKITYLLIAFLYALLFYNGYKIFLNYNFAYAGYNILSARLDNTSLLIISFSLAIIPVIFFNGVKFISSFLCVFIYYLLYVPIIITYFFQLAGSFEYVVYQQLLFLLGMILLFSADRVEFLRNYELPAKFNIFKIVICCTILLSLYMIIIYRNNLHFVSFADVYTLRFANDIYGKDAITAYFSSWLANAMIPICLAYGLFARKKIYFIIGTISCIIIYMATASKGTLLFPLIIYGLFKLLKNKNLNASFSLIGLGLIVLMFISLQFDFNTFTSLLWMRTIGNGGYLTKYYHDFFLTHPNTYYTHINIINFLSGNAYPYPTGKGLGQVVGAEYWSSDMNANANFWATDGYAALGDIGILVSSILLFFIFLLFNKATKSYNKLFLILIMIPYLFSILNMSLFSSLLTGGGIIVLFILIFKSSMQDEYIKANIE